jgi:hypothetical protein
MADLGQTIKTHVTSIVKKAAKKAAKSFLRYLVATFIDGRDDVYLAGTNVFQDYTQAMRIEVDPDAVLQKYGVETVLLPADAPLTRYLEAEPQKWKVSYRDKITAVLRRQ